MKYSDNIFPQAKVISTHFDENIFVFFRLLWPVLPFILLYSMENFIVPAQFSFFLAPVLKLLKYWAGCAIAYHWMSYCLTGNTPSTWWRVLTGPQSFWHFFGLVIAFRLCIDLDRILFFVFKNNHYFIRNFDWIRYLYMAAYIGIAYLVFRLSFVLPMLAHGAKVDFKASWKATAQDPYKIILSGLRAALPYLIAIPLITVLSKLAIDLIFEPGQEKVAAIFNLALFIPVELVLVPILLVLGASTAAYHYRERLLIR